MTLMLTTDAGPLVVLDRCVLSYRRIEEFVPENAQYVLTDTFFFEASAATPDEEGPKFNAWAKRFVDRLFVAQYWDELSRMEKRPGQTVHPKEIIHAGFSYALREEAKNAGLDWSLASRGDVHTELQEKQQRVAAFTGLCERFSATAQDRIPGWRKQLRSQESQHELIRQPGFIASFVQQNNERVAGPEWKEHLQAFPDKHAVGRWVRLVAWYAIQHSLGRTHDFGNNYCDAEYAFAASYVGRIATTDGGLTEAIRAVFPYVDILCGQRR